MRFRFIVILGMVLLLAGSAFCAGWKNVDFTFPGTSDVLTVTWGDGGYITFSVADKEYQIYPDGSLRVATTVLTKEWKQIYPKITEYISDINTWEIPEEWKVLRGEAVPCPSTTGKTLK